MTLTKTIRNFLAHPILESRLVEFEGLYKKNNSDAMDGRYSKEELGALRNYYFQKHGMSDMHKLITLDKLAGIHGSYVRPGQVYF